MLHYDPGYELIAHITCPAGPVGRAPRECAVADPSGCRAAALQASAPRCASDMGAEDGIGTWLLSVTRRRAEAGNPVERESWTGHGE